MSPRPPCSALKRGLRLGALHGAWNVFKRCSGKCQVALSVLHWSVESHVNSELSGCQMWQSEHVQWRLCECRAHSYVTSCPYGLTSVKPAQSHSKYTTSGMQTRAQLIHEWIFMTYNAIRRISRLTHSSTESPKIGLRLFTVESKMSRFCQTIYVKKRMSADKSASHFSLRFFCIDFVSVRL